MSDNTPSAPGGGESPRPLASRGFVLSAATVGIIAVLGLVVTTITVIDNQNGEESGATADGESSQEGHISEDEYPEGSPSSSDIPRSDGSESVCGLAASEENDFSDFPEDTSWEYAGTMETPTSNDHGPGETEDNGYRHCYADSPEGAVLAAMNYVAMTGDPLLVTDLMERMYAEGPGKDRALERLEELEREEGLQGDSTRGHMAGARLLTFGSDRARVDVAVSVVNDDGSDSMSATPIDLRWEDGDWRVVTNEEGEMVIPMSPLHSLDGYIQTEAAE